MAVCRYLRGERKPGDFSFYRPTFGGLVKFDEGLIIALFEG